MKILSRISYALVFSIIGAIALTLVAGFLQFNLAALFWLGLFGDNLWPEWALDILEEEIIIFSFVLGAILGIIFGAKYVVNFKKARLWLRWGTLAAGIIIVFGIVYIVRKNHELRVRGQETEIYKKITSQVYKIKDIILNESQEGLTFDIYTQGSLFGKYELILEFDTSMAEKFFVRKDDIFISSRNETVQSFVAIDDLEAGLRKQLELGGRVRSFDQRIGNMGDTVEIHFKLRLLEDDEKLLPGLKELKLSDDKKTIKGKITYSCYRDSCEVTEWIL